MSDLMVARPFTAETPVRVPLGVSIISITCLVTSIFGPDKQMLIRYLIRRMPDPCPRTSYSFGDGSAASDGYAGRAMKGRPDSNGRSPSKAGASTDRV